MSPEQIVSVRNYLCKRFGTEGVTIKPRKVQDSVEVYLNDEILGGQFGLVWRSCSW